MRVTDNIIFFRERVLNATSGSLQELNVQGLQPGSAYEFRVVAHNQHGIGESSQPLRVSIIILNATNFATIPSSLTDKEGLLISVHHEFIHYLCTDHDARGVGCARARLGPKGEADELLLHIDQLEQARLQQQLRPPLQALLQTGRWLYYYALILKALTISRW